MKNIIRNTLTLLLLTAAMLCSSMSHSADVQKTDAANPQKLAADVGIELPDNYTWKIRNPFVFYFRKDAESRAADIMEMAEAAHKRIVTHVGVNPPGWIQVYLTSSVD